MPEKFTVQLVTPKGVMLDKEVEEIIAPGVMGEFGVLIGHTPMLTFIQPGVFSYLENDKFIKYAVGAGFCEVLKDSATVLVEEAYSADKIDPSAASSEVTELEQDLSRIDSAADPEAYQEMVKKLKVARAKVTAAA